MSKSDFLRIVCAEGEGQKIEFKAKITALAKEIVAFANASGGSLFLGISDDGEIVGIDDSNRLRSQIQDVANGCDPRIDICIAPRGNVVEIIVPEGTDKPYRCKDGFFLRIGPNSQQLNRDEILRFAIKSNKVRFDEQFEPVKNAEKLLDNDRLRAFCRRKGLPEKTLPGDLLTNLGIAQKQQKHLLLTRAAVLFFCREPQSFFPEAFVTCALYADDTRSTILDRIDATGTLEEQFEAAVRFIRRNLRVSLQD
jgi:ATP-dependent DNA helicase RecG